MSRATEGGDWITEVLERERRAARPSDWPTHRGRKRKRAKRRAHEARLARRARRQTARKAQPRESEHLT